MIFWLINFIWLMVDRNITKIIILWDLDIVVMELLILWLHFYNNINVLWHNMKFLKLKIEIIHLCTNKMFITILINREVENIGWWNKKIRILRDKIGGCMRNWGKSKWKIHTKVKIKSMLTTVQKVTILAVPWNLYLCLKLVSIIRWIVRNQSWITYWMIAKLLSANILINWLKLEEKLRKRKNWGISSVMDGE